MDAQHSTAKSRSSPTGNHRGKVQVFLPVALITCMATSMGYGFQSPAMPMPDNQIKAVIKERLEMDTRVDPIRMQIEVKQGQAILSGLVETLEEKFLAEQIVATSIMGLKGVTNNITVRPTVTNDDALEQKIATQLRNVPALSGDKFKVSVNKGMVKLEGTVQKPRYRKLAQKAVETVSGVRGVVNLIKLVGPQRQDVDIHKDVRTYLTYSPFIEVENFDYQVTKGVITLTGVVEELAHRDVLARDLDKIDGVVQVDLAGVHVKTKGLKG